MPILDADEHNVRIYLEVQLWISNYLLPAQWWWKPAPENSLSEILFFLHNFPHVTFYIPVDARKVDYMAPLLVQFAKVIVA